MRNSVHILMRRVAPTLALAATLASGAVYTSEPAYQEALRARGLSAVTEGFESDPAWTAARSPLAAAAVSASGLRWTSNHPTAKAQPGRISTGPGAARTGNWAAFSLPHGDSDVWEPNGFLRDGFVITREAGATPLLGVGGWFSGTPGGKAALILDGNEAGAIELGPVDNLHRFYGVLSERPFTTAEFRELEGKREDQRTIFGDDFTLAVDNAAPALGIASAASYSSEAAAPGSLVSAFGTGLSAVTDRALGLPLPEQLGGVTVVVTDASGATRAAPLLYVSPAQINFVFPEGTAPGTAGVAVRRGGATAGLGTVRVATVAPALFSADATGRGAAAAMAIRVSPSEAQEIAAAYRCDQAGGCEPVPVDLGRDEDRAYLVLFGTGIRGLSSLAAVKAAVAGEPVTVTYAGSQGQYAGLDQVNILLPRTLRGRGMASVELSVEGRAVNVLTISVL